MGYREIEIPRSGTPVFIPAKYYEDKLTPDADTEVTTIIINPNMNLQHTNYKHTLVQYQPIPIRLQFLKFLTTSATIITTTPHQLTPLLHLSTQISITLRLRNQLNKNLYIASKDRVIVNKDSEEPWVIDGNDSLVRSEFCIVFEPSVFKSSTFKILTFCGFLHKFNL